MCQAEYHRAGTSGGDDELIREAVLDVAVTSSGSVDSLGALSPVHRLRTILARELVLSDGDVLGEGSFGKVQVGVWRGTDVAIKTSGVDSRDATAIGREREMSVMFSASTLTAGLPLLLLTQALHCVCCRSIMAACPEPPSFCSPLSC
jgi:hypothetical protein